MKVVLAAYGVPGIFAIETLFSMGFSPDQIGLLTHQPDLRNNSLWKFAEAHQLVVKYFSASSEAALKWIKNQRPDILFSLHYREHVPKRILEIPKFGCVNLHPSLLPNYRGCFSIPWAIINGERELGFTYHYMVEKFDEGNIIYQKSIPILESDTAFSLFHKLIIDGMNVFDTILHEVCEKENPGYRQPLGGSYYPRKLPFGGVINQLWNDDQIERFIRAMYFPPHKGATVMKANETIEVNSLGEYYQIIAEKKNNH